MNLQSLIENLINFYKELLNQEIDFENSSWASRKIGTLKSIDNYGELSSEQLFTILETILSATGFSLMAGNLERGYNKDFKIKDIDQLGNISDIRGVLLSKSSQGVSNLVFESLVRAWYNQKFNTTFPDLANSNLFEEGQEKCEFIIDITSKPQLVECKKINTSRNLRENLIDNLTKAEEQLNNTAYIKKIDKEGVKHLLVDISELIEDERFVRVREDDQKRNLSFKEISEEKMQEVSEILSSEISNSDIDQATLVSEKIFQVDGEPSAIIQYPKIIKDNKRVTNFQGWTAVLGKGEMFEERIKNLMIYSEAKSDDWLIAGQDGLDGIFFSQGPGRKIK